MYGTLFRKTGKLGRNVKWQKIQEYDGQFKKKGNVQQQRIEWQCYTATS